jgi:hypothetical protein
VALSRVLAVLAALAALAVGAASAQARFVHFKSPSGNIDCTVSAGGGGADSASCIVRSASWPHTPAKPGSCQLDWAPSEVDLSGTRTSLGSCRGDIGPLCFAADGPCSTLGYGRTLTVGRIRCLSATAGITCRRTDGRRVGFMVSRERYRLYR